MESSLMSTWWPRTCVLPLIALLAGCGSDPSAPVERTVAPAPVSVAPAVVAAPVAPAVVAPAAPLSTPVYTWDPATFQAGAGAPFTVTPKQRADGGTRPLITLTGGDWNTYLMVPTGVLHGSSDYTATLSYEVVTSPKYPGTFHMFARSKRLGIDRDVWLNWLGEPGERGTARLPMRLAPGDDWTFSVGCKGPGAIIIDSFAITTGTGFIYLPATTDAAAPSAPSAESGPVATGCSAVVIDPPAAGTGLTISTTEFGLTADGASGPVTPEIAAANALALQHALKACTTRNASRLVIPPGVYRFNPKEPITIGDQHDLIIDGQGAELIFTKLMRNVAVLNLTGCKRVVLRDLNIDWDWTVAPIASLGVVESIADDRLSCVMRFPDLDAAATERIKTATWMGFSSVDPVTFFPSSTEGLKPLVTKRETKDANALTVGFSTPQALVLGRSYMIRHLYYEMGAFKLTDCSHVLFDRVTIYSMPGMGWIGRGDLDHIGLVECRIARRPGSRNPLTTAADGFHILDSHGGVLIDRCEFTGTGDDCINIHDNCAQGVRKTGSTTLVLVDNPRYRMKVAVGDRLELFRSDYSPIGHIGTVSKFTLVGNDTVVEFAEPLPETVSPLSIVFNRRYGTCDVRIINSRFSHGRVLISAQRATIEGCDFDRPYSNAIQLHTEIVNNLWAEGSGAGNVVIRGNTFHAANMRGKFNGAVIHGAPVLPAGRTQYPLFRDILIEDNRFIDSRGPVVNLGACANVVVRGNRIEADAAVPGANAQAGSVLVECSSDLRLGGNTWVPGAGQRLPGVLYDPQTTTGLEAVDNRLSQK